MSVHSDGSSSSLGFTENSENDKIDEPFEESDCSDEELAISLFDSFRSKDVESVWRHMRDTYGFDMNSLKQKINNFDDYKRICLINFFRKEQIGNSSTKCLIPELAEIEHIWNKEEYLIPVQQNDRLLWELPKDFEYTNVKDVEQLSSCVLSEKQDDLLSLKPSWKSASEQKHATNDVLHCKPVHCISSKNNYKAVWMYEMNFNIDTPLRKNGLDNTSLYKQFVQINHDMIKGKTVLCLGCRTGTLSRICAQAGAFLSVGIFTSSLDLEAAQIYSKEDFISNLFFFSAQLKQLDLWMLPLEGNKIIACQRNAPTPKCARRFKCDLLVMEWIEQETLWETMFHTVFDARDRFLDTSGTILPSLFCLQVRVLYCGKDFQKNDPNQIGVLNKKNPCEESLSLNSDSNVFHLQVVDISKLQVSESVKFECPFTLPAKSSISGVILKWIPSLFHTESFMNNKPVTPSLECAQRGIFCNFQIFSEFTKFLSLRNVCYAGLVINGKFSLYTDDAFGSNRLYISCEILDKT